MQYGHLHPVQFTPIEPLTPPAQVTPDIYTIRISSNILFSKDTHTNRTWTHNTPPYPRHCYIQDTPALRPDLYLKRVNIPLTTKANSAYSSVSRWASRCRLGRTVHIGTSSTRTSLRSMAVSRQRSRGARVSRRDRW